MKIEESAIKAINGALEKSNKDYLHIGLINRCHGNKSLDIRLIEKEEAEFLSDFETIVIDIDEEAKEFLKDFTLKGEGNGIAFVPPKDFEASKSNHEGGCCDGHHHDHEGGCCTGHHNENGCCSSDPSNGCCCGNK